jgi:hypothetical protein
LQQPLARENGCKKGELSCRGPSVGELAALVGTAIAAAIAAAVKA